MKGGAVWPGVLASAAVLAGTFFWLARAQRAPFEEADDGPRTEHEWIVGSVARDASEMVWRAAGRLEDGRGRLSIRVVQDDPRRPGAAVTLRDESGALLQSGAIETKHYVWSPRDFQPWVETLLRSGGVVAGAPSGDDPSRLLQALTEPTAAVLHRESAEVARALEQDLRVAARHEDAALVLGAFALRESAGEFADTRALLSRMTAHLTLGRALRPNQGPGATGVVAEAVLLALAGRQAEAMQAVAILEDDARISEPARSAWCAALRLRATEDWRQEPPGRSLLERRELYRALVNGYDPIHADERMAGRMVDEVPDWSRISLQRLESAPQAHRHLRGALEREQEELRAVWTASRSEAFGPSDAATLDRVAEGCLEEVNGRLRPQVLQWGDWAGAFQRHAALLVYKEQLLWTFIQDARETADAEWARAHELLGKLRLFPLVEVRRARTASDYASAMTKAVALVTARPEQVTAQNWLAMQTPPRFAPHHSGVPSADAWFVGFPAGTTVDGRFRMERLASFRTADVSAFEAVRSLSPYDGGVVGQLVLRKYPVQRTPADIEREFGERSRYDPLIMHWMVKCCWETNPSLFREVMDRLCALDPERCMRIGSQLADRGLDEAAAVAYQRAADHGLERPMVADQDWLAQYYYARGEHDRALRLARAAAGTGTTEGEETLGRLLERMGRLGEARRTLERVKARDGGSDALTQFLYRRGPAAHREFLENVRPNLPNGLEPVAVADLQEAPSDGVWIGADHENLQRAGITMGNVIVGVDGFRVRSVLQYHVIRGLEQGAEMDLVVWNGSSYREARVAAPRRMLDAGLVSYAR